LEHSWTDYFYFVKIVNLLVNSSHIPHGFEIY
jgi:hypothetical protein